MSAPTTPLDGVRVIDFTQVFLGPSATQLLADHGAEVIKVERPGSGELMRGEELYAPEGGGENPMFASLNRNKSSIAIDMRSEAGKEVVLRLVESADVVVHNFRPGVMARLGLDFEDLKSVNPQIVFASGSGYGPSGPLADLPGQDSLAQAMSGVMPRKSEPDAPLGIYPTTFGDYGAGMHLVIGILLALRSRDQTGEPQRVDISLYDSLLALQMQEAAVELMHGEELNWAQTPLSGVFETSDGAVVLVGAFRENPLRLICRALGIGDLSEDARFDSFERQAENRGELHRLLGERFAELSTDECVASLREADILVAPVRTLAEALAEEQTTHNQMILEFEQDGRPMRAIASPIALDGRRPDVRRPVPALGSDTDRVLEAAGFDSERIAKLRAEGVVA